MNYIIKNWNKFLILLFSILALVLSFTFVIDIKGKELIDDSFTQAVLVFGSAKALNAVISLAQGTELSVPFFTLAIGEVLDPINDLVEQFAFVMLASLTSLGIQKILMNFVTSEVYNITLAVSLVVLNIWLFFRFSKDEKFRTYFFKIAIVLVFLRFAVPLMGYVNDLVYENFVKSQYNIEKLNENIIKVKDEVSEVTKSTIEKKEEKSFFSNITDKFDSSFYAKKVDEYKNAVDNSSEYIVGLIIAFVFQTIFLPVLFLLVLYGFVKTIFGIRR